MGWLRLTNYIPREPSTCTAYVPIELAKLSLAVGFNGILTIEQRIYPTKYRHQAAKHRKRPLIPLWRFLTRSKSYEFSGINLRK